MVDIETLDTLPSAEIISIGACPIVELAPSFYTEPCQVDQGRTNSLDTINWWKAQSTKGAYYPQGFISLKVVLQNFSDYIKSFNARPIIWCKGTDFDTATLANAYRQYQMELPWKYNDVRDFRTLVKLHPHLSFPRHLHPHHALEDALYQARCLNMIFAHNTALSWE
jgi:hypothetical protein